MFKKIDLAAASNRRWDIVIAGSSFAAMFFLRGLPKDLSVLVIEKGEVVSHEDQIENGSVRDPDGFAGVGREQIDMNNLSGKKKLWISSTIFGGNSNFWVGQTPRFHPSDFRMHSLYGIGQDWPIDYTDLEPYYCKVEEIMEIAGGRRSHMFPMSCPYPHHHHKGTLIEEQLWNDNDWMPVATARSNGGSRPGCCANGPCSICPIDSKFTVLNGVDHFSRNNAYLLTGAEARRVLDVDRQEVTGIEVVQGRSVANIIADNVALATNALNNPAILLRSGVTNPAVGAYLHEQTSIKVAVDVPQPNYFGGTSITGHNYGFYDGSHRRDRAAVMIENFNVPALLRYEPGKWTQRMFLKLVADTLPQERNRVVLNERGEKQIVWYGHSEYADRGLQYALENLNSIFPWPLEGVKVFGVDATEAHIQGTCRISASSDDGVVDDSLRMHGTKNLWVLGASAFPTCSPANPTLTLSALSLRAARSVI